MYFIPLHQARFYAIMNERVARAVEEAKKIRAATGVEMKVEFLKPVHLGLTDYLLPVGTTTKTLKTNCCIFFAGILNKDPAHATIKWYKGPDFIGEWFTRFVNQFEEKQGVWSGDLKKYEFRGNETFTMVVDAGTGTRDAWPIALVIIPKTMTETAITS